jgi:plastocyanin
MRRGAGAPAPLVFTLALSLTALTAAGCAPALLASGATSGPVVLEIGTGTGMDHRFVPGMVEVPAGATVRLVFHNRSATSHNLSFTGPLEAVRTRTIMAPGDHDQVAFEAPVSGDYPFVCTVHEGMTGWLRVVAASR